MEPGLPQGGSATCGVMVMKRCVAPYAPSWDMRTWRGSRLLVPVQVDHDGQGHPAGVGGRYLPDVVAVVTPGGEQLVRRPGRDRLGQGATGRRPGRDGRGRRRASRRGPRDDGGTSAVTPPGRRARGAGRRAPDSISQHHRPSSGRLARKVAEVASGSGGPPTDLDGRSSAITPGPGHAQRRLDHVGDLRPDQLVLLEQGVAQASTTSGWASTMALAASHEPMSRASSSARASLSPSTLSTRLPSR